MKTIIISCAFILTTLLTNHRATAQVAVNADGSPPAPSSMLDISSQSSGLLIPRMNTAQRGQIANPADGLMIFNLDCGNFNYFFDGEWVEFPSVAVSFNGQPENVSGCDGSGASFTVVAAGYGLSYQWQVNAGSGWNDLSDDASYNGVSSPTLVIPAATLGMNNYQFRCVVGNTCGTPDISDPATLTVIGLPANAGSISGSFSVIQNTSGMNYSIDAIAGATSYTWSVPSGSSVSGGQGSTNISVDFGSSSGDICVTAQNGCGSSSPSCQNVTVLTEWACGLNLTINHVAGSVAAETKTVNYGTVETDISGSTKCWITQNLGADQQAGNATDATDATNGWYWQWNRAQGWKAGAVSGWDNTDPTFTNWSPASDPCTLELGPSWRIPTHTEYSNALTNAGISNINSAYSSVLKLHTSGTLYSEAGDQAYTGVDGIGFFQASDLYSGTQGYVVVIGSAFGVMSNGNPVNGFSIRCIKD